MARIFFFIVWLGLGSGWAQEQLLKGKVLDEKTNAPLPFASVFFNTTTIGTTTNTAGEFSLSVKPGVYELIVSMVGYEPLVYQLDARTQLPPSYVFKIQPKAYALNTVSVKAKRDPSWYDNLAVFKQNFIGKSELAQGCNILNTDQLVIVYDPETGVLDVHSEEPLRIENASLGYRITYILTEFRYDMRQGYVTYLGYPSFEILKGSKARQRKWTKNRIRAYNGSVMHFVRALRTQRLEAEGFNLRRLERLPNPNRPTEEELAAARERLRKRTTLTLTPDDPDQQILSQARLPKIIEKLDTARVPYDSFLIHRSGETHVSFKGYFNVVFTGEKEEPGYVQAHSPFRKRQPTYQTSVLSLKEESVWLDETGSISPPLGVFFEGYWGWEKIGDTLPLDYTLGK